MRHFKTTFKVLKPNRQWMRFSLRTFFIVLTLLCLLLAMETNRARKQKTALVPLRELGGSVFYNHDMPVGLHDYLGDDLMSRVVAIDFAFTDIDDADLQQITSQLQELPSLSWVRFSPYFSC